MKRFLSPFRFFFLTLLALLLSARSLSAFDWEARTNEVLFSDMMKYASMMVDSTSGTALRPVLKKFVKAQKKQFKKRPYAWMQDTYDCVCRLTELLPPVYDDGSREARLRRMIFRLCDFPIHQHDRYDKRPKHPAGHWTPPEEQRLAYEQFRASYMADACAKAVEFLRRPAPKPGELAFYKSYNMGVILRTDKHCIAIDLGHRQSDELTREVVEKVDILFMTHRDGDHRDVNLMGKMLDAGKTVFLAYDVIPDHSSPNKRVVWENVLEQPIEIAGIQIRLVAGFQGKRGTPGGTPNNIYHITLDGWSVTHNGDNNDLEAYRFLSGLPLPDIAVTNCWNKLQYYMSALKKCKGYGTKDITFISAHENEMFHNVQQRESWWETFTRKDRYGNPDYEYPPVKFLLQGESVTLRRQD